MWMWKLFLLSIFTFSVAHAVEVQPLRLVQTRHIFEARVATPSALTYCAGQVWAFSVGTQSLVALDATSGKIIKGQAVSGVSGLTKPLDVVSMSCKSKKVYLLFNTKAGDKFFRPQVLEIDTGLSSGFLSKAKRFVLPKIERASDLFCNQFKCYVIQNDIYETTNFSYFKKVNIPAVTLVSKFSSRKEENPFEDWQSTLNIAKPRYLKGSVNLYGEIVALDPFQMQFVVSNTDKAQFESKTRDSKTWFKWGRFGAWEGSLMMPKALLYLQNDILAVADAKLKAVFLFQKQGKYLGMISQSTTAPYSPSYPLSLAGEGQTLFVADFLGDQIQAFELIPSKEVLYETGELTVRHNLFRRPEVMNSNNDNFCLNCHDGTQSNQLSKFVGKVNHGNVSCFNCHDPHHEVKKRFYLRKEPTALCESCHEDHTNIKTNHIFKGKKGGDCLDCHQSHGTLSKLLVKPTPKLCMDCHQQQKLTHRLVENLLKTDRAKDLRFYEGNISCYTCHDTHVNWKEAKFVKESDKVRVFCASCHGDKTNRLFQDFHKIMKTKGVKQ